jgi:hypothetical protein
LGGDAKPCRIKGIAKTAGGSEMNRCECPLFVHPDFNQYCDDHCKVCGHGWAEHRIECNVDLDDIESFPCDLCMEKSQ